MTKVVVITGGIGSGKSEVCRIFADEGFAAQYNADARAKALYIEYPSLLEAIEDALGCVLKDDEGKFQPSLLAARIFADRTALETVESLLFPVMMDDFAIFAERSGAEYVVFESATVLEKPQFDGFADKVILVDAPFETRLGRACARDGASREAVLARMRAQTLMNELSQGGSDPRVDYVIMNDSSFEVLRRRTRKTIELLTENI